MPKSQLYKPWKGKTSYKTQEKKKKGLKADSSHEVKNKKIVKKKKKWC